MNENNTVAMGTVCNPAMSDLPAVKKCAVSASLTGGDVTGDDGIPLLRQIDRRLGPTRALVQISLIRAIRIASSIRC